METIEQKIERLLNSSYYKRIINFGSHSIQIHIESEPEEVTIDIEIAGLSGENMEEAEQYHLDVSIY